MIVPTMSYIEMYDSLVIDIEKINIRIQKVGPKAVKKLKKSRTFPAWYIDDYNIPSTQNHHVIFFYADNYLEVDKPRYEIFTIVYSGFQRFVIRGLRMGYKHNLNSELVMLPQIHAYTNHFFQRYNERFIQPYLFRKIDITPDVIAGIFFVRNKSVTPIDLNEDINMNYKDYGDSNKKGILVKDGLCYTRSAVWRNAEMKNCDDEIEAMMFLYTTFMNESNLNESQKVAIRKEYAEVLKRCKELL